MTLSTGASPKKSPGSISGAWSRWCIAAQASKGSSGVWTHQQNCQEMRNTDDRSCFWNVFGGIHWFDLFENLQENTIFNGQNHGRFSLKQWGKIVFFFEMKTFGRPEKHRTAVFPEACCWQTKLVQRRDRGSCRGEKRRWMTQYPRSWMAGKQSTLW